MTGDAPHDPAHAITVEIVAARPEEQPGVVALLLDHAERRGLRLTWHAAGLPEDQLEFRLAFGRHQLADPAVAPPAAPPLAADPLRRTRSASSPRRST